MRNSIKFLLLMACLLGFALHCSIAAAQSEWETPNPSLSETFLPLRIVSLAPNVTEMVYFLGFGDKLVGRTDFCNYPQAAQALPTVGGFVDTSLEKIISLNPDLVVAYQGNSLELLGQLEHLKVPVLAFHEAQTLDGILDQMENLQHVLSGGASNQTLDDWLSQLDDLTEAKLSAEMPSMMFGYPGETTFTCGPTTFVADVIRNAGAVNITDKLDGNWISVSAEFVLTANPDWILTATSCNGDETVEDKRTQLLGELSNDPVWSALTAVKQSQVIVLDSDVLLRPGPRILEALLLVQRELRVAGGSD